MIVLIQILKAVGSNRSPFLLPHTILNSPNKMTGRHIVGFTTGPCRRETKNFGSVSNRCLHVTVSVIEVTDPEFANPGLKLADDEGPCTSGLHACPDKRRNASKKRITLALNLDPKTLSAFLRLT
jgi:hypothetical protein